MNHKLVMELEKAGFPRESFLHTDCDEYGYCCRCGDGNNSLCTPTLEELVKACGNPLMLQWFEGELADRKTWQDEWKGTWQAFDSNESVGCLSGEGEEVNEAVARLWLAKKEKSI